MQIDHFYFLIKNVFNIQDPIFYLNHEITMKLTVVVIYVKEFCIYDENDLTFSNKGTFFKLFE